MIDPFLRNLIAEARACALKYWTQGFEVATKPDRTLVTEADRAVEALIRARLTSAFPADGIYGEEQGAERLDAGRVWVIDPIDGTQAFVLGVPVFAILIALVEGGQVVQAVADFPAMDVQVSAAKGQGALFAGRAAQVSTCQDLRAATLSATSTTMFIGADKARFEGLVAATNAVRYGLDAFGFCTLARGRVDLAVEACLKPYDYLAPSLIVAEAGGRMTDWAGAPLTLASDGKVVAAATPSLHRAALHALQCAHPGGSMT